MMEQLESLKVVSMGGLNSSVNHLQLSDQEPGSAVNLLNFESSLNGGYRKISGYQPLASTAEFVDNAGAEGPILCVAIFNGSIISARKQKASNTYKYYRFDGSTWVAIGSTPTPSSIGVTKIRYRVFNFNGTPKIAFVDGVNNAYIYDGTNWSSINTSHTGASFGNAGGDQAVNAPKYIAIYKNHLFLAQDNVVVHSAPLAEYDFRVASGAGQIPAGYSVNQIKEFRDSLIVFGIKNIKKIEVSSSNFVLNEITQDIGCIASDSVVEVGGNVIFLSQDGFRPISNTDRIGDLEIESISRKIQQVVIDEMSTNNMDQVTSVLIRGKSQIRIFFSSSVKEPSATYGIIGCLRSQSDGSFDWEWSRCLGINPSSTAYGYIGSTEYILHGSFNGAVYRQEQSNSFNGAQIQAFYATPFIDFGDAGVRKTLKKIRVFIKPEGDTQVTMAVNYDWADPLHLNPDPYNLNSQSSSNAAVYGLSLYGSSTYAAPKAPVLVSNIQGSGYSAQLVFSTVDTNPSYTIHGIVFEFDVNGRK